MFTFNIAHVFSNPLVKLLTLCTHTYIKPSCMIIMFSTLESVGSTVVTFPVHTVTEPISESQLEPLIQLLLSSDIEVQKASSLAISNLALHGPRTLSQGVYH